MSPRRRHPNPADVRTHLLDAALRVFARRGYEGSSIRDLAAEARVASGLLYHYFPSKQAILEALFARSGALVMQAFAEAAAATDVRSRLARLLTSSARLVRQNEELYRVSYGVRFQHAVLAGLSDDIALQSASLLQLFTMLLTELGCPEPALEARLLFATLDGVFQHYVLDPLHYPLDSVIERLIQHHGGSPAEETS
jgi:AcrR family transcriptional regulator